MFLTSFVRREYKYLINRSKYETILPYIQTFARPDDYCTSSDGYFVANIYYDTPGNNIIRHSVSDPYFKEKLRMRFYSQPKSIDDPVFVEMKKKLNGIVSKRRITLPLGEAESFLTGVMPKPRDDYLFNQISKELMQFILVNDVRPSVRIDYKRIAFFSCDNPDVRITFDYDITSCRDDPSPVRESGGIPLISDDEMLMEIKFSNSVPIGLARLLSEAHIYRNGYSKYGNEYKRFVSGSNERYGL
ncbi:hypothetical protein SDC9_104632 [bioreactor metagenome]|uniref:VTC domain-containing protein n=1 Tax=bioreactor metagenome TaxID=1076179 RepID=A0A645AXI1_9ZZZZ|nr:polyphosphate polymerase domain-containing protein [Oscillospiraceae bacterium]